jgi:nicotinamidase-related amidase
VLRRSVEITPIILTFCCSSSTASHSCIEATVRDAAELGYEVAVAKDATADHSDQEMHAVRHQYPEPRQRRCHRYLYAGFMTA